MKAIFIELPAFERHRSNFLDDDSFRRLQDTLMANAEAGDPIREQAASGNCALAMRGAPKANVAAYE
jgi:hypothetical protein